MLSRALPISQSSTQSITAAIHEAMQHTRRTAISAMTLGLSGKVFAEQEPSRTPADEVAFPTLTELKNSLPWAGSWKSFKHDGIEFTVCVQDFPSYGQSHQVVHLWRHTKGVGYKQVWKLATSGIGAVAVTVDETKGTVSASSVARKDKPDALLGMVICSANKD
jgi:hypothetical protein